MSWFDSNPRNMKLEQHSLFNLEPVSKPVIKAVSTKKKIALSIQNTTDMELRGLNGVWKDFGEFIVNGRNNKTL